MFCLSLQSDVVIVIMGIAGDVFEHLDERRELHALAFGDAFGFQDHQVLHWL